MTFPSLQYLYEQIEIRFRFDEHIRTVSTKGGKLLDKDHAIHRHSSHNRRKRLLTLLTTYYCILTDLVESYSSGIVHCTISNDV